MREKRYTSHPKVIAVDFDGTIVEHRYPDIGQIIPGAFEVLKALQDSGHKLILWTVRDGVDLQEAVDFCKQHGIVFFAVNNSYPDEEFNKYISRKIDADIYIDDKNVGGFVGWNEIRRRLLPDEHIDDFTPTRKTFFQRLFGK